MLASQLAIPSIRGHLGQPRDHGHDQSEDGTAQARDAELEATSGEQERKSADVCYRSELTFSACTPPQALDFHSLCHRDSSEKSLLTICSS